MSRKSVLLLLFSASLILFSCSKAAPERRYALRGEVLALDPKAQSATIKHQKIDGWMEAMTMEFPVKDVAEYRKLSVGDQITATVVVRDLSYYLENIKIVGKTAPE